MLSRRFPGFVVLVASLVAVGCMQTTYRPLHQPLNLTGQPPGAESSETDSFLERRVDFRLADAFYQTLPDCVAVMTKGKAPRAVARLVEDAVERHLATRLPRVIGAGRLRRAEGRLGLQMKAEADRRVFARQARCPALVEIHLAQVQDDYLVLWAQRGIRIGLVMTRIADGKVLWQAHHSAARADGGLPISIIDLPVSAARAAMVTRDPEMFASIADDAVRRMMKTLPDIKGADGVDGSLARF